MKKVQLLLFFLYLCLGGRNALGDLEISCDRLVKTHMLDGLFQVPAEENPISLDDLVGAWGKTALQTSYPLEYGPWGVPTE